MTAAGFIRHHDRTWCVLRVPRLGEIPLDNPTKGNPERIAFAWIRKCNGRLGFRNKRFLLLNDFTMALKFVHGQVGDLSSL